MPIVAEWGETQPICLRSGAVMSDSSRRWRCPVRHRKTDGLAEMVHDFSHIKEFKIGAPVAWLPTGGELDS